MGEFAFIDWLRRRTPADPRVPLGPGDDTAVLRLTPGAPCLVTTDMLLEGSCFLLAEAGPRRVGRKALAADLWHLCQESRCGAVLRAESIPIAAAAGQVADGLSPLEHALGDGEDFELVFAVTPEEGRELVRTQPVPGVTLAPIGECVAE